MKILTLPKNIDGPIVLVSKPIEFTFPLGYAYLAGYLRDKGHKVIILYKDINHIDLVRNIISLNPLLVGFGTLYPELKETKNIIDLLNKAGRKFPIVIGGQMVSPTPEFAVKITGADFGVIGEGEIILHQLATCLRENNDPYQIKGLAIKDGQNTVITGPGAYIENLKDLPPVPYEMFPEEKWLPIGKWYAKNAPQPHWKIDDRVISIHGGRGCPFKCNFCYHHSKPRYREIKHMMSEASEALARYKANMLYFSDDLVLPSSKRASELIYEISKLNKPIEFSASVRFDILDNISDDTLFSLKKSGCRIIGLGIESGSDRILKYIGKNTTADKILYNLERLKKANILPTVSIMVGQYKETWEDIELSVKLMRESVRHNPSIQYAFTVTTPFPGSKLYNHIIQNKLIHDDQEFYDRYFSTPGEFKQVVNLSSMSDQEILKAYNYITYAYNEEKQNNQFKASIAKNPKKYSAIKYKPDTQTLIFNTLKVVVKPGWTCLDINDDYGESAIVIADSTGQDGKVFTTIQDIEKKEILNRNFILNGVDDRINCIELNDTAHVKNNINNFFNIIKPYTHIDFINIDSPKMVLIISHFTEVLRKFKPILLLRFRNDSDWAIRMRLKSCGYLLIDTNGNIIPYETEQIPEICIAINTFNNLTKSNNDDAHNNECAKAYSKSKTYSNLQSKKTCVFVNTYYFNFLNTIYTNNKNLNKIPYDNQLKFLLNQCFGDSYFYSKNLSAFDWSTHDLIINCKQLQNKWSEENNFNKNDIDIAIEQIRRLKPTVTYIHDLTRINNFFIDEIRPFTQLIVGQIAYPIDNKVSFEKFDIIISSLPNYVHYFRNRGICAYYQPLAFEPTILKQLPELSLKPYQERTIDCSFIGGLSNNHPERQTLLSHIQKTIPLRLWGYGANTLHLNSDLIKIHNGELWGLDMFSKLFDSKITINQHINIAQNNANNMRLFEATGCGALLITDYKDNLQKLFKIGDEIIAYRNYDECAALIQYYLTNTDEASKIAQNGQLRTLRDHTYPSRMKKLDDILTRHLKYKNKQVNANCNKIYNVSTNFNPIKPEDIKSTHLEAWKDESIPAQQRKLVNKEIFELFHSGIIHQPFKALLDILQSIENNFEKILEIGCASGYYSEIIEYTLCRDINYTGVDYSQPLINMAKEYYPNKSFTVADGANLPFRNKQFDTVISSCILLHTSNFNDHIAESARVCSKYIITHRTPIKKNNATTYFTKFAYGVETVEIHFNETEFINILKKCGFKLKSSILISAIPHEDIHYYTYLFEK